ncbi:hypothetical protein B0G57_115131 [Trinickia symbiotica]|uniref:Group 1 glycosyl transferase n=1 Tax=Trinickia symbiotica TaxID=863227 RepID=A0A2N7X5K1_9BURK|nr:hypothetical protein [Trinickia symbiotica]PMS37039.1 group 1 glycosyl transferase [Trinickia symbiotica]PPK43027.1 hypothetical protein B0G57_115131 [Trinickia symbiotica]
MSQRALVIEPDFSGHRWRYVEWTIEALIEAGYDCTLSTDARNREHPLIRSYQEPRSGVSLVWLSDGKAPSSILRRLLNRAKQEFAFHTLFASAYRAANGRDSVDLIVVPYGDYILKAVAILGSPFGAARWMCVTMRQFFHMQEVGVAVPRRPLFDLLTKQLFMLALCRGNPAAVLSIDPTLLLWHQSSRLAGKPPSIYYLADPFPEVSPRDKSAAKARLGITADRSILVYGAISERKGIFELLGTCMTLDGPPLIIIAGEQDDAVSQYLSSFGDRLADRIAVFNHFISAEMEVDLFSACDVVWIGYKDHYGMSGVLVQAYKFGKIAIASSAGLIGWFAKRDQMGPLLDDLSASTIRSAIDDAIRQCQSDAPSSVRKDRAKLLAQHTVVNFKETIKRAVGNCAPAVDGHDADVACTCTGASQSAG